MGRKAKFDETQGVPIGRGKKGKKQSDPTFPEGVLGMQRDSNVLIYFYILHICIKL